MGSANDSSQADPIEATGACIGNMYEWAVLMTLLMQTLYRLQEPVLATCMGGQVPALAARVEDTAVEMRVGKCARPSSKGRSHSCGDEGGGHPHSLGGAVTKSVALRALIWLGHANCIECDSVCLHRLTYSMR